MILKSSIIRTIFGEMILVASETALYFSGFLDGKSTGCKLKKLEHKYSQTISTGTNRILEQASSELSSYFSKKSKTFSVKLKIDGTEFQTMVYKAISGTLFGSTISYTGLARLVSKPAAARACANACKANNFGVIIPCHRIIHKNGQIGDYNGEAEIKTEQIRNRLTLSQIDVDLTTIKRRKGLESHKLYHNYINNDRRSIDLKQYIFDFTSANLEPVKSFLTRKSLLIDFEKKPDLL
ncbi:MAG: methylated-DNA--[protein]-cysteine S-methyltransferase [Rickettsiaceae bacterium]|nr:methylated-DNA--[protein]-cysteine S-methyltransferase [Rickettsiaceae bacterium]